MQTIAQLTIPATMTLLFTLVGCPSPFTGIDESDATDNDSPHSPSDEDCNGIDRNDDWDCDGRLDWHDFYNGDPRSNRQLFYINTVDWTDDARDVFSVGSHVGSSFYWQTLDRDPSIFSNGEWWEVRLDPDADGDGDGCTIYRHTLRGPADNQWADLLCRNQNTRDPACMRDNGCAFSKYETADDAMAVTVCEWGTRIATEVEREQITLSEDVCPRLVVIGP